MQVQSQKALCSSSLILRNTKHSLSIASSDTKSNNLLIAIQRDHAKLHPSNSRQRARRPPWEAKLLPLTCRLGQGFAAGCHKMLLPCHSAFAQLVSVLAWSLLLSFGKGPLLGCSGRLRLLFMTENSQRIPTVYSSLHLCNAVQNLVLVTCNMSQPGKIRLRCVLGFLGLLSPLRRPFESAVASDHYLE